MSNTTVILTGTGVPHAAPGRAGAGVLVRSGDVALQFDAGRGTVLRMADAGITPLALSAQFVTHYHSDHVVDLVDVVMTRWIMENLQRVGPLPIITPNGPAREFVEKMLHAYGDDLHVRQEHVGSPDIVMDIRSFDAPTAPTVVWSSDDGAITVSAIGVRHEPVRDAVAYRVDTPDGAVVISGDTRACSEVFELARGAQIVVHEACRTRAMAGAVANSVFESIFDYHADTVEVGRLAAEYDVPHLVLTHLIPAPKNERDESRFESDVRSGGYTGMVSVGRDLMTFSL